MLIPILLAAYPAFQAVGKGTDGCDACDGRCPVVAIKTNLLHDAVLTPDLGLELSLSNRVSVGIEGVYAWWSNESKHRCWRIRGGWLDVSCWFGSTSLRRRLTGHHAGIYVSMHGYDFEFGGKGWQARRPAFGVGVTYGYSFRLNGRLSMDFSLSVGYAGGNVTEYVPQCGTYYCVRRYHNNYFGPTRLGVSLVWFPGRGTANNPAK